MLLKICPNSNKLPNLVTLIIIIGRQTDRAVHFYSSRYTKNRMSLVWLKPCVILLSIASRKVGYLPTYLPTCLPIYKGTELQNIHRLSRSMISIVLTKFPCCVFTLQIAGRMWAQLDVLDINYQFQSTISSTWALIQILEHKFQYFSTNSRTTHSSKSRPDFRTTSESFRQRLHRFKIV